MTEDELATLLQREQVDAASYYDSELAKAQADAMRRFFAEPYGDEVDGRSKVVTHDVEDTINWMMPDLMRTFMSSDELVTIEPAAPEDEQPYPGDPAGRSVVETLADYLDHIFFKDNDGTTIIYDFAFDGLLQRSGVISVEWMDPEPKPVQMLEGVSAEQLVKYTEDPEYEILEQEQEGGAFSLKVRRTPRMGRVHIEAVPPEEFKISRRAKSIKDADYHGRRQSKFLADIIRQFPKKRRDLDPEGTTRSRTEEDNETDDRREARWPNESSPARHGELSAGQRKVDLDHEMIRCDFDDDGIVELRSIKRVGKVILENIEIENSGYSSWSPIRISHKNCGRSVADTQIDIQRIRTVITRKTLDGLAQSLTPRNAVNVNALGTDGVDDVLDNEVGGLVRCKGDPREAIMPLITPDVSGSAHQALEYWDQRSEEASGVTRHSQGLDPSALNKTASGIDLLQAAAKTRTEMVARWLGKSLEEVFCNILKLAAAHQDKPRQLKLKGRWVEIDPRRYKDDMAVTVHVGMSSASRAQQIANLNIIAQKQEQVLVTAGPGNPLVTITHLRNTYARMCEAMGFKDPTRFFAEIPEEQGTAAAEPPPDPKLIEVQGNLQLEQAKAQHAAELAEAQLQSKMRIAEFEADTERQIALLKINGEQALARMRIASEQELARERMANEMELAQWKAGQEIRIAESAAAKKAKNGKNGASDGYRPGGDLSK